MRALCIGLAISLFYLCAPPAYAYKTEIAIRDFANKLATDDVVIVEEHYKSGTDIQWLASKMGGFEIRMIDQSVEVGVLLPNLPGVVDGIFYFQSLDKLHDLTAGKSGQVYSMRVMFSQDLIWIEVWPSNSSTAPVRNAVMFFGPSKDIYTYYLNNSLPDVRYTNEKELKSDINLNYSSKYNPNFINLIQYPSIGRKAIMSTLTSID